MDSPIHTQLYNSLKDWFTGGFSPSDQLPTEQDIMQRFTVGRGTVRVALNELVRDGIIIRTAGKGSFLAPDYRVRLKRYAVGILLSEREFAGSDNWEYSWHNHMEMLNGVMREALQMNLSLEIIPEGAIGSELNNGFDAFISFRYIREEKLSLLNRPVIPFHYELDLAGGLAGVVRHLESCGYRHPAYIGTARAGRITLINSFLVMNALSPLSEDLVIECSGTVRDGYEACSALLEKNEKPDCIICSTDMRALGVLNCLKDRNVAVPGTLGVYGFDGMRESASCSPPLTTWAFPWQELGVRAVQELRFCLDGVEIPPYEALKGSLIERDSSASGQPDHAGEKAEGADALPAASFLHEFSDPPGMDRRLVSFPTFALDFSLSIGYPGLNESSPVMACSPLDNWDSFVERAMKCAVLYRENTVLAEIVSSLREKSMPAASPLSLWKGVEPPVLKARSGAVVWKGTVTVEALDYPLPALRLTGPEQSSLLRMIVKNLEFWRTLKAVSSRVGLLITRDGGLFRACMIFYKTDEDEENHEIRPKSITTEYRTAAAVAGCLSRPFPVDRGEDLSAWIDAYFKKHHPGGIFTDKKAEEMLPLFGADKDELI